jgi:antitoxin component of RelBE/YafQ-DinJ toxin-antitoxin module
MGKNAGTYARLDDKAEEAVSTLMSDKGLTKSSAINTIIREWSEMKKQYVTVPVAKITLEEEFTRR